MKGDPELTKQSREEEPWWTNFLQNYSNQDSGFGIRIDT